MGELHHTSCKVVVKVNNMSGKKRLNIGTNHPPYRDGADNYITQNIFKGSKLTL